MLETHDKCQIRQTDKQKYVVCYAHIVTAFFFLGRQQLYLVKIPKENTSVYIRNNFGKLKMSQRNIYFRFQIFSFSCFVLLSHFDFSHFS